MGRDFVPVDEVTPPTFSIPTSAMSVFIWCFPDTFVNDARLFSKTSGSAEQNHVIMISGFDPTEARLRYRLKTGVVDGAGTTTLIAGADDLTLSVWQIVTAWYDGVDMKIYKNGVEIATVGKTGAIRINAFAWAIGNQPGNVDPLLGAFDGKMGEFVAMGVALTVNELLALFHGVNPFGLGRGQECFLSMYGSYSPIPDLSGNDNDGVLSGTTKSFHPPVELVENYL